jgi:phenylalanyl-tRNA synthetase alpha chain
MERIIAQLHPLERKVLPWLDRYTNLKEIAKQAGLQEVEAMRALQWLSNKEIIKLEESSKELVELDENGLLYKKDGLPETRFLKAIKAKPLKLSEIKQKTGLSEEEIKICLGTLKSKAAIDMVHGVELSVMITTQGERLIEKDSLEEQFLKKAFPLNKEDLVDEERYAYTALSRRKNIIKTYVVKTKTATLTDLGKKILAKGFKDEKIVDTITPELLKSGDWKKKKFRAYDIKINVPKKYYGKRHFVNEAISYIRKIWLEMGFKEMQGTMVQTAFWDLDALFVPQDHPAREMQDTFYIKYPEKGRIPEALAQKIKQVHENGSDTGSLGWRLPFSMSSSKQLLLRTHTTVLSAQTIAKLKKEDLPAKFFSVGKVFRNEAMDWSHLFELYQVEGIVVDPNANLKHLKGYLKEFYTKMGYSDVRMRPGHFPYTEPSMEVEAYHPERKEWVELGGAGIFRPEVVKPLLGEDIPVLAWGLGMERIIASYYNITDIRNLYDNGLKQLRDMKEWVKL